MVRGGFMDKEKIGLLASLYLERKMNEMVYEAKLIPKNTYDKTSMQIMQQIQKLEKTGVNNGLIKNAARA